MSDIWLDLYAGKRWTDDDGEQHAKIHASQSIQITVKDWTIGDEEKFKAEFVVAVKELERQMTEVLGRIGSDLLRRNKFGLKPRMPWAEMDKE